MGRFFAFSKTEAKKPTSEDMVPLNKKSALNELLDRVKYIEKECTDAEEQGKLLEDRIAEIRDEFERNKARIYSDLENVMSEIREREQLQKRLGQNILVVEKGALISNSIRKMEKDFKLLTELFSKHCKNSKKLNLSEDDLNARYEQLNLLKRRILDAKKMVKNPNIDYDIDEYKTLTEMNQSSTNNNAGAYVGVTAEYKESELDTQQIQKWRQRDQEFDEHLQEIGEAIDRIGEVAVVIGEKADRQNELAKQIQNQADEASDELKQMNNRLKNIMQKQNNFTCMCRLLLCLILLGLVIMAIQMMKDRIKK